MRRAVWILSSVVAVLALPFLGPHADAADRAPSTLDVSYSDEGQDQPAGAELRFRLRVESDAPPSSSSNGTMTLREGDHVLGSETVPANDDSVYVVVSGFTRGDKTLTAEYGGGPAWEPSQTSFSFHVAGKDNIGTVIFNGCSTRYTPPGSSGPSHCDAVGGEEVELEFLFDRHWEWTEHRPSGDVVFTASAPPSAFPSGFGPIVVGHATVDGYHAVTTTRDMPVRASGTAVGCYTLRADYEGDDYFEPTFATQSVCVRPPDRPDAPVVPQSAGAPTTSDPATPTSSPSGDGASDPVGGPTRDGGTTTTSGSSLAPDGADPSSPSPGTDASDTTVSAPFADATRTRTAGHAGARAPLGAAAVALTTIAIGLSVAASGIGPWTPLGARRLP